MKMKPKSKHDKNWIDPRFCIVFFPLRWNPHVQIAWPAAMSHRAFGILSRVPIPGGWSMFVALCVCVGVADKNGREIQFALPQWTPQTSPSQLARFVPASWSSLTERRKLRARESKREGKLARRTWINSSNFISIRSFAPALASLPFFLIPSFPRISFSVHSSVLWTCRPCAAHKYQQTAGFYSNRNHFAIASLFFHSTNSTRLPVLSTVKKWRCWAKVVRRKATNTKHGYNRR